MSNKSEIPNELKAKALSICKKCLDGQWKYIGLNDLVFEKISGGLTNALYRCALGDALSHDINTGGFKIPNDVLMRIYGPLQDDNNAVIRENVVFAFLSERNLGPKLYGIFEGGRLEEYVPSRTVNWNDFSDIYLEVAKEMAKIHCLEVPISKTPVYETHLNEFLKEVEKDEIGRIPHVIASGEFRREVAWLQNEVNKLDSKVVFCHNDLCGGNILLLNDVSTCGGRRLLFIDFEFCGYNYRGFDIGDYFGENCFLYKANPLSYEVDFQKYPTRSQQVAFIEAYLMQSQKEGVKLEEDFQTETLRLLKEISVLSLAANLYCSACSFRMAVNPPVDFPFYNHGNSKWEAYNRFKDKAIKDGFVKL